jgi:hypothetical protein
MHTLVHVLEGADPDGVPIVVTYPAVLPVDVIALPARVYAY